jgi:hypothetical protein
MVYSFISAEDNSDSQNGCINLNKWIKITANDNFCPVPHLALAASGLPVTAHRHKSVFVQRACTATDVTRTTEGEGPLFN